MCTSGAPSQAARLAAPRPRRSAPAAAHSKQCLANFVQVKEVTGAARRAAGSANAAAQKVARSANAKITEAQGEWCLKFVRQLV